MSNNAIYEVVPEPWRAAVERVVRAAFPGAAPEALAPLAHGGQSGALLYKLTVAGEHYIMRIIRERNALSDPHRQFAAMRVAADLEVAPPLYAADAEAGVCIMGYVEPQPLHVALRGDENVLRRLGALVARLHGGPAFPVFLDPLQYIQGGREHLAAQIQVPASVQAYLAQLDRVSAAVQPHLVSAPCHNDLNPGNVLYDGSRLWLVDYDAACMGDPLLDLASLIHWFALTTEQEEVLLGAYFGGAPDERQRAKLELMKHVSWCFYALVFLLIAAQVGQTTPPPGLEDAPLPSMREAIPLIGAGALALHVPANRFKLGMIIAAEGLRATRRPAFEQALQLLGA